MIISDETLNEYVISHSGKEDELLASLNRQTWLDMVQPRMLSGHLQGRILEMISHMINPRYILEIGTFTGYSAICLARGLQDHGRLITLEINDELKDIALEYFKKSGLESKIELVIGNALEIIPTLDYYYDLVFMDGDKKEYIDYYQLIMPRLNPGGYILADNVLWDGKVIDPKQSEDPDTKVIKDFNNLVMKDKNVDNVIIPVRDGINIIRKKG